MGEEVRYPCMSRIEALSVGVLAPSTASLKPGEGRGVGAMYTHVHVTPMLVKLEGKAVRE